MKKVLYEDWNFEITKREVVFSIVIVLVMICIGLFINEKISSSIDEKNDKYYSALKINDDEDVFAYGMETNAGNAFVHGDMTTVDPVTYPEIGGEYQKVEKVEEKYTMHTRQVAHTSGSGKNRHTYYTTETYWTWDRVESEDVHCNQIIFCGSTFDYEKIDTSGMSEYIQTIKESSHIRYKYYGIAAESSGTIFTKLYDGTIEDGTDYYYGCTIDVVLEKCIESGIVLQVLFWFGWIILTGGLVFGFYYLDNKWLED